MKNPLILASGILGVTKASLRAAAHAGAGAVTIKSVSLEPRKGHDSPVVITCGDAMLNAVGYSNPGLEEARKEFAGLPEVGAPVIASIIGESAGDFARMAEGLLGGGFAAVEVPLSCPHTPGYGMMGGQGTPEATYEITEAVRKNSRIPVIVKLNAGVQAIGEVAKAAERAGADAINVTNSIGPGMVIDVRARKPVLGFGAGGISGPAIRPLAVRAVYDVFKSVRIPVIGTGGVESGEDAAEMLMAGASAVGIGWAVYKRGLEAFAGISKELAAFMKEEGFASVKGMVGIAHD